MAAVTATSGRDRTLAWAIAGAALLIIVAVVALLVVRAGDSDEPSSPPLPPQVIAPLTGLPTDGPVRPALMVKVDNVEAARPQTGLGSADVIVEAMVEGGLTRLSAVYSSTDPGEVGPVRSVRVTDLSLARLFGRPVLAFSGGAGPVLDQAEEAAAAGGLVLVSESSDPAAFTRRADRSAPHNLYVDAGEAWTAAPDAEIPRPLVAFGPPPLAEPVTTVRLPFPSVQVRYDWDAERAAWLRSQDGTPHVDTAQAGTALGVTNVLVLRVTYRPASHDERSPVADLRSGGQAWVFRNGTMATCRWSTDDGLAGPSIELRTGAGTPCLLEPGRTIVELSPGPPGT